MRRLAALTIALAALLVSTVAAAGVSDERPPILVYISWDGSPGTEIDRLLAEGKLPNLRRLANTGVHVRRSVGNWPSVTPSGHAAVYTGAYGNVNGITEAQPRFPLEENFVTAFGPSAFSAENLLEEPI